MRIRTTDGAFFLGDSPEDVVRQMKNTQWGAPERKREYMAEVVERVENMTGMFYNPEREFVEGDVSPPDFLEFLRRAGMVEIVEK
jgi:hypothetical protein